MSKLDQILNQIEKLQAQAESERKKELKDVIADIREQIAKYELTQADLFGGGRGGRRRGRPAGKKSAGKKSAAKKAGRRRVAKKSAARKGKKVPPKYRDPQTGATWTGRGRTPRWVVDAEKRGVKRDKFLIAG